MESPTLPYDIKHKLYEEAVQCHENDISFIQREYYNIYKREPLTLREDFGGTGLLACDWTRLGPKHQAWAIDLDPEPIAYGKEIHLQKLNEDQRARMHYIQGNVLEDYDFRPEVIVAFNFSYFIFKKRQELLNYFTKVRSNLGKNGMFVLDLFGGTEARQELEEETEHDDFSYYWDCHQYNPISHECLYYIHFKYQGTKYEKVFTYDWRMWGLAELRDMLQEAGFSHTIAYWEGEDGQGGGDGNFYATEQAENCESWVTYLVALP